MTPRCRDGTLSLSLRSLPPFFHSPYPAISCSFSPLSLSLFMSRHASNPPVTRYRLISPATNLAWRFRAHRKRPKQQTRATVRGIPRESRTRSSSSLTIRANNLRDRDVGVAPHGTAWHACTDQRWTRCSPINGLLPRATQFLLFFFSFFLSHAQQRRPT